MKSTPEEILLKLSGSYLRKYDDNVRFIFFHQFFVSTGLSVLPLFLLIPNNLSCYSELLLQEKIEYFPKGGKCVELKSLKYYFVSFRNVGIYQEAATKRIYSDLLSALDCEQLMVTTIYNIRGGFQTTCVEGSLD